VVRLADWPRAPYLNDELRGWMRQQLGTLGVEEIAVYAVETRGTDEVRRIMAATEVGLLDETYAPTNSAARYRLAGRLYPWQAVRGVDLRVETVRVWALEDRTRWSLQIGRPGFAVITEDPQLGSALCDFAKVCSVMAEPFGWPLTEPQAEEMPQAVREIPQAVREAPQPVREAPQPVRSEIPPQPVREFQQPVREIQQPMREAPRTVPILVEPEQEQELARLPGPELEAEPPQPQRPRSIGPFRR